MKMRFLALAAAAILSTSGSGAQTNGNVERTVRDNVLTSARLPQATIVVPHSFTYEGAVHWPLYNVADCELHAFVEADNKKKVRRLIWIQFEGYLPDKPDLHYKYNSPNHTIIDGKDFFVDAFARSHSAPTRQGSDSEHIEALLMQNGAFLPNNMSYVRLVHLLDDQKRRELMIIYGEALPELGPNADDLKDAGSANSQALLKRATAALQIRFAN
jgi:hypothetical protein